MSSTNVQYVDHATPTVRRRSSDAAAPTTDIGGLQTGLLQAVSNNRRLDGLLNDIAHLLHAYTFATSVTYCARDNQQQLYQHWQHIFTADCITDEDYFVAAAQQACQGGRRVWQQLQHQAVLAVPVLLRGAAPEVIVVTLPSGSAQSSTVDAVVQMASAHIPLWMLIDGEQQLRASATRSQAVLGVLTQFLQHDDFAHAARQLVNQLRQALICDSVALALAAPNDGLMRLTAVSSTNTIDRRSEQSRLLESALEECRQRNDWTAWPADDSDQPPPLTFQQLATHASAASVVGLPLIDHTGDCRAALVLCGDDSLRHSSGPQQFLTTLAPTLAESVPVMKEARGGRVRKQLSQVGKLGRIAIIAGVAAVALTMLLPMPYHVRCDAKLQPVIRRFVAAPFDGTLEKTLVKPGDIVDEGDVLAQMDGRDIRLQRAALVAKLEQSQRQHASSLAKGEAADAKLAKLELQKLQLERDRLDQRMANLDIKSPIDGIVVSGDLERVEGAPLTVGQSLFEIGPTEQMLVEIAVPESEVAYVETEQSVQLWLDAYPGQSWNAKLQHIQPRAEIIDNESVFVAEVQLNNDTSLLRPGMSGRARIATASHPLGWNLFHRAWDALRKQIYW